MAATPPLVLDLARYYGRQALSSGAALHQASQAAIDLPVPAGRRRRIELPPWDGRVDPLPAPLFLDNPRVALVGAGVGVTTLVGPPGSAALVVGARRVLPGAPVGGATVDPTLWIDCHGKLDASFAAAPGTRWAVSTGGLVALSGASSPLTSARWPTLPALRVEYALETATAVVDSNRGNLFGVWSRYDVGPWACQYLAGRVGLRLRTGDGVYRQFWATPPPAPKSTALLVVWQVDFVAGKVLCGIGPNQVAVDLSGAGAGWGPGLRLAAREYGEFKVGSSGIGLYRQPTTGDPAAPTTTGFPNVTLYGLKVASNAAYADAGAGGDLTRIDKAPLSDYRRFGAAGDSLIDCLTQADPPSAAAGRVLHTYRGTLLVLSPGHGDPYCSCGPNEVRDLTLGSVGGFGSGLLIGEALNLMVKRVECLDGAFGIQSLNCGTSYPATFRDLVLRGDESGIYRFFSAWDSYENIRFEAVGRRALHAVGTSFRARGVFVPGQGSPEHIILIDGYEDGGLNVVDYLACDFEGGPSPSVAVIECRSERWTPANSLVVRDSVNSSVGPGACLVRLVQGGPPTDDGARPARFSMERFKGSAGGYGRAVVVADPLWSGNVDWYGADPGVPIVAPGVAGQPANLTVNGRPYGPAPAPTTGAEPT